MPCYQPSSLPSGVTTTGRTGYATEADCLAACKEGACCEGTTCSVKPQCQCVCQSGSCCGPDNVTYNGVTGPACRFESKAACAARGGIFRCGKPCLPNAVDEKSGLSGNEVFPCWDSLTGGPEPVFKGVGTVCSPNPCLCPGCGTMCPAPGCLPTYIDISYSLSFPSYIDREVQFPGQSFSGTVTLQKNVSADGCGTYDFNLQGAGADALDVSLISVSLSVGTTGASASFFCIRKITDASDRIDPCFGPFGGFGRFDGLRILRQVNATAPSLFAPGTNVSDGTWAGWSGSAGFTTPFGLLNNLCYSSGSNSESQAPFATIDEAALARCDGSTATVITKGVVGNVISVTLLRSYN